MLTEMALGWCAKGVTPPEGVAAKPLTDIDLLTGMASDPRQVLVLQQSCFEAGIDLLPLSAAAGWTAAAAERATKDRLPRLMARLQALRGLAQITLMLDWAEPSSGGKTGRDWLQARKDRAISSETAAKWLQDLVFRLDLTASPGERRPSCALIHLLTPRDALPRAEALLACGEPPLPGARLTVTGPWPPHAFAGAA